MATFTWQLQGTTPTPLQKQPSPYSFTTSPYSRRASPYKKITL